MCTPQKPETTEPPHITNPDLTPVYTYIHTHIYIYVSGKPLTFNSCFVLHSNIYLHKAEQGSVFRFLANPTRNANNQPSQHSALSWSQFRHAFPV